MGNFVEQLMVMLHPHYVCNLLLSVSFFILKTTAPFCYVIFDNCELEIREWELLTFLGCIIVLKNRKQASYNMYVSTVCMFAKLISTFMFLRTNPLAGVIYVLFCLLHIAFLPEPAYSGPDLVTYFRDNLDEELIHDRRVTWLVEFYAAWQPTCVNFANTFAQLSAKYTLDNLKFGKVDASRYPAIAEKYRVSTSSWSKQLPTLILFQNGKEVIRRPIISGKGNVVIKFLFSEENIVRDFDLNDLHHQCKKNPIKKKKGDLNKDMATSGGGDSKVKSE